MYEPTTMIYEAQIDTWKTLPQAVFQTSIPLNLNPCHSESLLGLSSQLPVHESLSFGELVCPLQGNDLPLATLKMKKDLNYVKNWSAMLLLPLGFSRTTLQTLDYDMVLIFAELGLE